MKKGRLIMELALIAILILWRTIHRDRARTLAMDDLTVIPLTTLRPQATKRTVPYRDGKVRWMWDGLTTHLPPRRTGLPITPAWAACLHAWGMTA